MSSPNTRRTKSVKAPIHVTYVRGTEKRRPTRKEQDKANAKKKRLNELEEKLFSIEDEFQRLYDGCKHEIIKYNEEEGEDFCIICERRVQDG